MRWGDSSPSSSPLSLERTRPDQPPSMASHSGVDLAIPDSFDRILVYVIYMLLS